MRRDRHLHIFHNDPVSFNAILSKALQLLEEIHGSHFAREAVIEIRVEDLLLLLCRTVYDKVNPSSRKTASRLQRRHHDEREDQRGLPHLRLQGLSELFQGFIREGGRKSYLFEAYRNFCNIYNNPVNSIFWLGLVIYIQQRKEQIKTAKTYSTQHQISIQ